MNKKEAALIFLKVPYLIICQYLWFSFNHIMRVDPCTKSKATSLLFIIWLHVVLAGSRDVIIKTYCHVIMKL